MITVEFESDRKFKTYRIVPNDQNAYGDIAIVEKADSILYAVVVDYREYDSEFSEDATAFVDGFSTLKGAEALALLIARAMDRVNEPRSENYEERQKYGVDYENDCGRMVRCSLSKWFNWGSSYKGVAIVTANPTNLVREGINYR